jgi:hypothetical protein
MVHTLRHLPAAALLVVVLASYLAGSDADFLRPGEKVTFEQVPEPVRHTIEQEFQGGAVKEIDRKIKGGKTLYIASSLTDGNAKERLVIDQDGKVMRKEVDDDDD